jgi:hypothetical protein
MNWRKFFGLPPKDSGRESRRDPDLDLMKHMVENHEWRLQELDKDLDAISGGNRRPYTERRAIPRAKQN